MVLRMKTILNFLRIGILALSVFAYRFCSKYYDATPCGKDPPIDIDGTWFLGYGSSCKNCNTIDGDRLSQKGYTYQSPCSLFSVEYFEARDKFRNAVKKYNRTILEGVYHPPLTTPGNNNSNENISPEAVPHAELWSSPVLAIETDTKGGDTSNSFSPTLDIAILPGNTQRFGTIVHSSGVHGVEGYAGSAIQLALLELFTSFSSKFGAKERPTVVLLHAVNPVGMKEYRRCNENNVDLNRNGIVLSETTKLDESMYDGYIDSNNRNDKEKSEDNGVYVSFKDFLSKRDPNIAGYDNFRHLFVPEIEIGDEVNGNPGDLNLPLYDRTIGYFARAIPAIAKHGITALKRGMVAGQYHHPEGLNYGGQELQVSIQRLLDFFVRDRPELFRDSPQVIWIDVHTGLGPFGKDTVLRRANIVYPSGRKQGDKDIDDDNDDGDDDDLQTCSALNLDSYLKRSAYSVASAAVEKKGSTTEAFKGYNLSKGMITEFLGDAYRKLLFQSDGENENSGYNRSGGDKTGVFLVQEFGTLPTILVGRALILDNMLYHFRKNYHRRINIDNKEGDAMQRFPYRSPFLGYAFYPQSTEWRKSLIQRGVAIVLHAIEYSHHHSELRLSKKIDRQEAPDN